MGSHRPDKRQRLAKRLSSSQPNCGTRTRKSQCLIPSLHLPPLLLRVLPHWQPSARRLPGTLRPSLRPCLLAMPQQPKRQKNREGGRADGRAAGSRWLQKNLTASYLNTTAARSKGNRKRSSSCSSSGQRSKQGTTGSKAQWGLSTFKHRHPHPPLHGAAVLCPLHLPPRPRLLWTTSPPCVLLQLPLMVALPPLSPLHPHQVDIQQSRLLLPRRHHQMRLSLLGLMHGPCHHCQLAEPRC